MPFDEWIVTICCGCWADGALRPPQSIVRAWMHSCYLLGPRGRSSCSPQAV